MKIFLDDERTPDFLRRFGFAESEYSGMVVVRNSQEMINTVKVCGMPEFISFDHDLGGEDTSRVFIKWLLDELLDGRITTIPKGFGFFVHSQNPIGAKWILDTMNDLIKEFGA